MTIIIIGLIASVVLFVGSLFLLKLYDDLPLGKDDWALVVGGIGTVLSVILVLVFLLVTLVMGTEWRGAKYKADIINREYDTNYTAEEVFWASDVIDTIQELKRSRAEYTINVKEEK